MIVKTAPTVFLSGLDKVLTNLNKAVQKMEERTLSGLVSAALEIKKEAQKLTPVVTGNLRNSAYVQSHKGTEDGAAPKFKGDQASRLTVAHASKVAQSAAEIGAARNPEVHVGFTAVYAPFVHENPRAGKTGGYSPKGKVYKPEAGSTRIVWSAVGQWKFLEQAIHKNRKKILAIIAAKAKE